MMTMFHRILTRARNGPVVFKSLCILNFLLFLYYGMSFRGVPVIAIEEETVPRPANVYCTGCTVKSLQLIMMGDGICHNGTEEKPDIDLLILIFTRPKNTEARNALRQTWLSVCTGNKGRIRYAFLIGKSMNETEESIIQEENSVNQDIVQGDFLESYYNLTTKTMLGLKWFITKCSHAKHILKTDDDVYVNIPGLLNLIQEYGSELETSVAGTCFLNITPDRNVNSKWYVSEEEYPDKVYPGYCSGTGYLLSANAARKVAEVSSSVPFFYLEDIYIGFCIRKLGYRFTKLPGFHSSMSTPVGCSYKSQIVVTSHQIPPALQRKIWNLPCSVSLYFHQLM